MPILKNYLTLLNVSINLSSFYLIIVIKSLYSFKINFKTKILINSHVYDIIIIISSSNKNSINYIRIVSIFIKYWFLIDLKILTKRLIF